jgi:hypothetical protein
MQRRNFCKLAVFGLTVSPGAALAQFDSGHLAFFSIGKVLREHLDAPTLNVLFQLAGDNGWMNGARPKIGEHDDRISRDFRADRVVKAKGVHFSQTEAALILGYTQGAA